MKNSKILIFKILIVLINIFLVSADLYINQTIGVSIIATLISLALFKKSWVYIVFLSYILIRTIFLLGTNNYNLFIDVLNAALISYLVYMSWKDIPKNVKTFTTMNAINVNFIIIFSSIMMALTLLSDIIGSGGISASMIVIRLISWMVSLSYFIGITYFSIRNRKCFYWFLAGAMCKLLSIGLLQIPLTLKLYIVPTLFLCYMLLIIYFIRSRRK